MVFEPSQRPSGLLMLACEAEEAGQTASIRPTAASPSLLDLGATGLKLYVAAMGGGGSSSPLENPLEAKQD